MDVVLFCMNVYQEAGVHSLNFTNKLVSLYLILLEKQPALKWFNHLSDDWTTLLVKLMEGNWSELSNYLNWS